MFIGHFGVGLALKRADKSLPLGLLFIAVQFVDIIFGFNVLLGIEKLNIVPGTVYFDGVEFVYYPFTRSLIASLVWAGVVYVLFRVMTTRLSSQKSRVALVMGSGVLSHFFLDVIVHRPDLSLFGNGSYKIGLGLWNYPIASYIVEGLILLSGLWVYMKSTTGTTFSGRYGMLIFAAVLLILNMLSTFGPPPPSAEFMVAQMLVFYLILTGIAFWLDRKRS